MIALGAMYAMTIVSSIRLVAGFGL